MQGFEWRWCLRFPDLLQRELELSPEQLSKLADIRNVADSLLTKLDLQPTSEQANLLQQAADLRMALDASLSESQQRRLEEILFQWDFSRSRWRAGNPPVSTNTWRSGSRYEPWGGLRKDNDWFDELVSPLSAEQRKQLVAFYGEDYLKVYRQARPMVIAHLYNDSPSDLSPLDLESLSLDLSGLLAPNAIQWNRGYEVVRSHNYLTDAYRQFLGLVKMQASLSSASQQKATLARTASEQGKGDMFDRLRLVGHAEARKLFVESCKQLEVSLDQIQIQKIEEACSLVGAINRGVYASLVNGELGRRLELTDSQRRDIEAVAERLRPLMARGEAEIVAAAFEAAIKKIPAERQAELRDRIGRPVAWRP